MTVKEIQELILFCKDHSIRNFAVGECAFEFGEDSHPLREQVAKLASEVNKLIVAQSFTAKPAPSFQVTGRGKADA